MKQFMTVFKHELSNYFSSKAFIGSTLVMVILIAAVMFIPRILNDDNEGAEPDNDSYIAESGSGDIDEEMPKMLVVGSSDTMEAKQAIAGAFSFNYNVVIEESVTEDDIKSRVSSDEYECAILLESATDYKYYVGDSNMYDTNPEMINEVLWNNGIVSALIESGKTPEEAYELMNAEINGETVLIGKDQSQSFLYTYIMVFVLYMVVVMYGQIISTNVATEKGSRIMELLITSVKPNALMFGKIFAACLAGIILIAVVFGTAMLFFNINKSSFAGMEFLASLFDIPGDLLIYMIVFFMLGYLLYSFLFGALGSTVSKLEDMSVVQTPVMMIMIIGFMIVIFNITGGFVDNMVMKVCSYIPFTSPMAMFARIAMSTVPAYEIVISIAILVVTLILVGIMSARIYRHGVLMYGKAPKIVEVLKLGLKKDDK